MHDLLSQRLLLKVLDKLKIQNKLSVSYVYTNIKKIYIIYSSYIGIL